MSYPSSVIKLFVNVAIGSKKIQNPGPGNSNRIFYPEFENPNHNQSENIRPETVQKIYKYLLNFLPEKTRTDLNGSGPKNVDELILYKFFRAKSASFTGFRVC